MFFRSVLVLSMLIVDRNPRYYGALDGILACVAGLYYLVSHRKRIDTALNSSDWINHLLRKPPS
jgi:hypothetical protein